MSGLTADELKCLLKYEPTTGCFTWISGHAKHLGRAAGTVTTNGAYLNIGINYKRYPAHHLVWLYFHGGLPKRLDHIDGNRLNNRIENLREADPSQNRMNVSVGKNNTSGVKGVSWSADRNRWWVTVQAYGVLHNIGYFTDLKEAADARESAAKRIHGEFARHSVHVDLTEVM